MAEMKWKISGDYFENCSCDVVCPCLVSPMAPLTSKPTKGVCEVAMIFHIDKGVAGKTVLDGLNVALVAYTPGPMAQGGWKVGAYIDQRASDEQMEALGAIFGGSAGGPMAGFTPLISENLGAEKAVINYRNEGKQRSVEIANIMHMSVHALPSLAPDEEIRGATGHPFNPTDLVFAVGDEKSTFAGHGMRWDNSGRNGHYAEISWSN